jgi:hypothetical protein
VRETSARHLILARDGRPEADIVLLGNSELLRNAADWLSGFVEARTGARIPIGGAELLEQPRSHLVALVGEGSRVKPWADALKIHPEPRVGPQGFVVEALENSSQRGSLVCWSPEEIGCRYGLIELLRSTRIEGKSATLSLRRVVERPRFPVRICYVNFAEHLQNAFNPNVLFDCPENRWSREDWERFIDMVSAFRYNTFEFWLVPSLFSPEALHGGAIQRRFADTINHVIEYGKRRGVAVHPIHAVNTVGREWHFHCPKDPREHAEIVALWDHWSRSIQGNASIGFFPGDPGGCTRNGCTDETYIELCLELSKIVRRNNPGVKVEVGTWGEPMGGWGVPLWTGTPDRAAKAMRNFLRRLPEFPEGTFTSINLGFSPDCLPNTHGGDGRPYAREAARICQPGRIVRDDFRDQGYRWLSIRLTEGPKGSRKTIAVNDRVVGQFVRTGPPVSEKKEWWVTRSYPIPPGLLKKSGRLEVRFTDPGIAISEIALTVEPVPGTDH